MNHNEGRGRGSPVATSELSELLHQDPFLMNDHDILGLKNELSVKIVKLVRTHLHNAQIEGIITADTRDRLYHVYVKDLKQMERGVKRKEMLERLHALENMQSQLLHAYQESMGELHTEIQKFQSSSALNEPLIQKDESLISQAPRVERKPKPTRRQRKITRQSIQDKFRNIQKLSSSSIKFLLAGAIITLLTFIGIRFGMTLFMAMGSLMIGGTLLIRFIKG